MALSYGYVCLQIKSELFELKNKRMIVNLDNYFGFHIYLLSITSTEPP